ncbi:dapper homolog 1 [Thalassophryne amazonica]|uniref:dapper homolog 1 n=1 Tax=Thalassophryne amazonica TaxID=390379 RepID=UPI001471BE45|nr:dapper homolog 1 [Thalassophryne amazonica]
MPLSASSRRDSDGRCSRERAAGDAEAAERPRSVRERLEAAVSGLGELEYLRQRQEALVRAALEHRAEERRREVREKLLQENILLLRKQLNCLRRRDAGLISQLQELDRQISDLRLDAKVPPDQVEMDSRPSSGFYELSDGTSGSLSNSSNSVFSECFCSAAEVDRCLLSTDELASCLECNGLVGGLCDDLSTGTVHCSLSAPHPPTQDFPSLCDSQPKYHTDLLVRNGSEVYRYPSPLHAVAVQSLQMLGQGGHGGHESLGRDKSLLKRKEVVAEGVKPEISLSPPVSAPFVAQSSSWLASSSSVLLQSPSHKHLDNYIYSLLQRKAQTVRANRPRTSISTDPSKSILKQASFCVRQVCGLSSANSVGTLRGPELKPCWLAGGASVEGGATTSPQRQWSVESKAVDREMQMNFCSGSMDVVETSFKVNGSDSRENSSNRSNGCSFNNKDIDTGTSNLLETKSSSGSNKGHISPSAMIPRDPRELGSPKINFSPKDTNQSSYHLDHELARKSPTVKTHPVTPQSSPKPLQTDKTQKGDRSLLEFLSVGSSSQSPDEGTGREIASRSQNVKAKYIPSQRQNTKHRKGGTKNVQMIKVKSTMSTKLSRASEHDEASSQRKGEKSTHRSSSKKSQLSECENSAKLNISKKVSGSDSEAGLSSSRMKYLQECKILDKHATSTLCNVRSRVSRKHHHRYHQYHSGNHHHHHHRHHHHRGDPIVVVTKSKYKRNAYQRLSAIMEVPCDESFRRSQHHHRKELPGQAAAVDFLPSGGEHYRSPYSYLAGSDSEYSAECASLFHSTIMDTSEDEQSNYTTNCFGDSESSEEFEDKTTTSDSEESGGGASGMARGWSRAVGQEMTPHQGKAYVKIKASHNLKKKILRFRTGSLKLMTTV